MSTEKDKQIFMNVLLIDDHALFRDGLLLMLESLNISLNIFEAGSYESAKNIMDEQSKFDLILLDLGLPGISHLDALSAIRSQLPDAMVVVMSGTDDHKTVEQALRLGVRGYIPKSSPAKLMLNALKLIIAGGVYIPPEILDKKIPAISSGLSKNNAAMRSKITSRQLDVLNELVKGKSNKKISDELGLTESTVRAHVSAILKAFSVSNRTQAVQYAMHKGWFN